MSYSGTTFTKKSSLACLPLVCILLMLVFIIAAIVGHVANIIQVIIWACGDAPSLTVYTITKLVAIFVPLLGTIMGYVGFFR